MPRPRKYVHVAEQPDGSLRRVKSGGREIHGLHVHKVRHGYEAYYTYEPETGKRKHLSTELAEAVRLMDGKPAPLPEWVDPDPFTPEQAARHDMGLPAPSREKLSDCVRFWREWKAEQTRGSGYLAETERGFKELIDVVGDKPTNQITKADFVAFERYLNREAESNDWHARRIKSLRAVFNLCIKKDTPPLPDALGKWLAAIESRPVVPAASNKKALPVELFKAMIRVCEQWSKLDVEAMPKETQSEKARRNRAWERKRNAVQFKAILMLAGQTGFGPEDICGLEWRNVVLDTRQPYLTFPRRKSEWKTGSAIPRRIPLLPVTVHALLTWQEYEKPNDYVFRNAQRGHWVQDKLSRAFRQIRLASDYVEQDPGCWTDGDQKKGDIWSFKHLRNIPGNVAHEAGIEEWVAGAILGHVPSTLVGKRYVDDPKPEMLIHLVETIGNRYL